MPRAPRWQQSLRASGAEALLAVRLFNDHLEPRLHMHVAWLYLLQAQFLRDGRDIRYRDPQRPRRLLRIDGEVKLWDLQRCVEERWPAEEPVRKNLELFIQLRNKFEHRQAQADRSALLALSGLAQAHLLNFERETTRAFGPEWSLATQLRFPVFVGTFTEPGEDALRRMNRRVAPRLASFIADYRSGIDEGISSDPQFELRLRVVLELAKSDPGALPIQFTRFDDMTEDQRRAVEEMGRRGQVVVREQSRPVAGTGLLRPREAVQAVADAGIEGFHMGHFTKAWQLEQIRPRGGSSHPARTKEQYCIYFELGRSYGYTQAYVQHLVKKCATDPEFQEAIGLRPTDSPPSNTAS